MKKGWPTHRLEEVCREITDGSHFSPKTADKGYPYITVRDIDNDMVDFSNCKFIAASDYQQLLKNGCRPNKGDVLFSKDGTVGKVALIDYTKDFVVLSSLAIVRPDSSRIHSAFLKWVLKSPAFLDEAVGKKTGAAIRRIILRNLKAIRIPVPPLAEQQRIVGLLDEAFEGLAAAKANAEKNLQNARALFESHMQSVFTQRGSGWVETTLDKISTNLDSKRVPITKSVRTSGKYPYYGASGIVDYVNDYIFEGDNLLVSEDGANLLARSTPIAFSVSGKYWVNNHAHVLHFENMATQRFAEFYLESIKLDDYITGAAQPKLNQKALNSIPIPIPKSVEDQAKIVENVESLQEETQRLAHIYEQKLAALEALKKSLLHQAFSGEL
jgi:type I restriction enzyme S subunit